MLKKQILQEAALRQKKGEIAGDVTTLWALEQTPLRKP